MDEVRITKQDEYMKIELFGRIDSGNAKQIETEIMEQTAEFSGSRIIVDMDALSYISSAGLRILLRLRKAYRDLQIINVSSEVYEILDMTGFTQMMNVEKAYRVVSVEGCEVIGEGANGALYRIDGDNVVKVYKNGDALEEIRHEREVARLALILGIPTAISYDVVRVGDSYGSVFELLDAKSFSKILAQQPEKMDWCVKEYVKLLKKIHETVVPKGKLPDMKETVSGWVEFMKDHLPEDAYQKLKRLVDEVPRDDHMIHGDYHTKNLELTGDEVLLIDMDTLAVGHPIFELASMFNAFIGFGEYDKDKIDVFMGFESAKAAEFWHRSLAAYLGTDLESVIRQVEDKARVLGYTRMIRRSIRRKGLETEEGRAEIALWKEHLLKLLERVDSLTFRRNEIEVEAVSQNLPKVMTFIEAHLDDIKCTMKEKMQISLAVEEIFVNIAHYAYYPDKGTATVRIEVQGDPVTVMITFVDQGVPYDPLKSKEPDVTLSAEEREIGGLGIFMVRKSMDDVIYEYRDGSNILKLKKELNHDESV